MTKPKVGLKVGRWLRTLRGCRIPSDWQGLLLLQLCTLGVHCSLFRSWVILSVSTCPQGFDPWEVKDFSSIALDHYLTLFQQVVFQLLELQEVPISPTKVVIQRYQQVNHQKTWALTQVKLTTEPATCSTSFQMLFVFPGLTYMTSYQKDHPFHGLIET